jgi:hypothetical protein
LTTALRLVLVVVGLAIGVFAVIALRDATLSTHERIAHDSQIELVVDARSKNAEGGQTLGEMVQAQVLTCRLEVNSDLDGPIESQGDGRFHAVLTPSMDETNRRQFRGCLEDWVIDGFQLDVIRLEAVGGNTG